jgi:hypothetical protein
MMSQAKQKLARRTLFAGVGTAGALAAVATVLPRVAPVGDPVAEPQAAPPEKGGGYRLTEHVQRYYKTTRL